MIDIQDTNNEVDFFVKYDNHYLEKYDDLFMLLFIYLYRHKSIEGYVNLTIKDFLLYHNYTPNRSKERINSKVYDTLNLMIGNGFIQYIGCYSNGGLASLNDVDCNVMFTIQILNYDDKWNPENHFTKIMFSEIDKLRNSNVKFMGRVLTLYTNIKKRMSGDINSPYAILYAFPSEKTLSRECGFGVSSVKKYTRILCEIGMLYVKNYGSYMRMLRGKEIIVNSNNIYALEEKYLDDNAKQALILYLQNSCGYIDGFYPFCDNLPNDSDIKKEELNDDIWGEPDPMDKDYNWEEIFDMPNASDLKKSL